MDLLFLRVHLQGLLCTIHLCGEIEIGGLDDWRRNVLQPWEIV